MLQRILLIDTGLIRSQSLILSMLALNIPLGPKATYRTCCHGNSLAVDGSGPFLPVCRHLSQVQGAVEAAMGKLANIVKRYARSTWAANGHGSCG